MEKKHITEVRTQVNKIRQERRAFNATLDGIDMLADFVEDAIKGLPELEARKRELEGLVSSLRQQESAARAKAQRMNDDIQSLKPRLMAGEKEKLDRLDDLDRMIASKESRVAELDKELESFRNRLGLQ